MQHLTRLLFFSFPREVGKQRQIVEDEDEFRMYVDTESGRSDVFTSIYAMNDNDRVIDKVFFDIDGEDAFTTARKLYTALRAHGLTVIPIISGRKGYHIYVLVRHDTYDGEARQLLTNAAHWMLEVANLTPADVDPHIIGDIEQLARIPGSLRHRLDNRVYCTYLPPYWHCLSEHSVVKFSKSYVTYPVRKYMGDWYPALDDFPEVELIEYNDIERKEVSTLESMPDNTRRVLKDFLRPCVFKAITSLNPIDEARVAATVTLLKVGFSQRTIVDLYSELGWRDFAREITAEKVNNIDEKLDHIYSCAKLKMLGIGHKDCNKCFKRWPNGGGLNGN